MERRGMMFGASECTHTAEQLPQLKHLSTSSEP